MRILYKKVIVLPGVEERLCLKRKKVKIMKNCSMISHTSLIIPNFCLFVKPFFLKI